MEDLRSLVTRAKAGDLDAFSLVVARFQDMALGYAYSVLGRFDSAEDAAQEAFIQTYRDLPKLRDAGAFPGWFRKIVFKHCDRLTRGKRLTIVPLEAAAELAAPGPGPEEAAAGREIRNAVLNAMDDLPEAERTVTTLFYINGYSHNDIADFLEVPVTTVNNRLHASRKRLRKRMIEMLNNELRSHVLPEEFPERIRLLLALPKPLDIQGHPVREMWEAFRACFPDFEFIELDEICERELSLLEPERIEAHVYRIDERRILRPEVSSQLVDLWLKSGGKPCRWLTAGRVFRAGHTESETMLEVHHQAEVFWIEECLDQERFGETIRKVASKLMPGIEFRVGSPCPYPLVPDGKHFESPWRGGWTSVAAGGVGARGWLEKAGLDPERYGIITFAFGLERSALVRYDLDDLRKLWQPPYVPSGEGI